MGGILSSLNTSYTGLAAHQVLVDVTGNNIANANDEFYARERAVIAPQSPINYSDYSLGRGVNIETIMRAHDNFVFTRYEKAASEHQKLQTEFDTLKEASTYFPDVDGVGMFSDLQSYFNAWKDITKSPSDPAQKQVLAQVTKTLTETITGIYNKIKTLQLKASEDLQLQINEVNSKAEQIANINKKIQEIEDRNKLKEANTLRDRRDRLEFDIIKIIGGLSSKSNMQSNMDISPRQADFGGGYLLSVGKGFNIVDNGAFHGLQHVEDEATGLNRIKFMGTDGKGVDITNKISSGKIGGLLNLYNNGDKDSKIGLLQKYLDGLNSFAKGLIDATNAIYAQSATTEMISDSLKINRSEAISDSTYNINNGFFELNVYNTSGDILSSKKIEITPITTINDIIKEINANTDDNSDGNTLNDFSDYFQAYFDDDNKVLSIKPKNRSQNLFLSISDSGGTNFAGALGMNRFFNGDSAKDIALNDRYLNDPTLIRPYLAPISGNFDVANMMEQLQYDKVVFYTRTQNGMVKNHMRISEYYQYVAGALASDTQATKTKLDSKESILNAVKQEHLGISQVSVDEEMVNLIKFQGGYAANAKVITAIDKMIDTLLSIKQ